LGRYIVHRLLTLIPTWIGVTLMAFLFIHAVPGGPFDTGAPRSETTTEILNEKYHLDQPLPTQYFLYMKGVVRGDLGESMVQPGLSVSDVIRERFPTSALLGFAALTVALSVGVSAGVIAAVRRHGLTDRLVMLGATVGYAIPNFVLSILLLLLFALKLGLFPVGGWGSPSQIVLPALALGLPWASLVARLTRTSLIEALHSDYVRTAHAKGASTLRVVLGHASQNAALPLVTVVALLAAELITGSLIVESIFGIPGMGYYLAQSVLGSDYTLTLGLIVFYATLVFFANLAVDVSYAVLDPRIRYG
jgi:ABC-type dipeptide/oligopeptide/nickel transport system permease component